MSTASTTPDSNSNTRDLQAEIPEAFILPPPPEAIPTLSSHSTRFEEFYDRGTQIIMGFCFAKLFLTLSYAVWSKDIQPFFFEACSFILCINDIEFLTRLTENQFDILTESKASKNQKIADLVKEFTSLIACGMGIKYIGALNVILGSSNSPSNFRKTTEILFETLKPSTPLLYLGSRFAIFMYSLFNERQIFDFNSNEEIDSQTESLESPVRAEGSFEEINLSAIYQALGITGERISPLKVSEEEMQAV